MLPRFILILSALPIAAAMAARWWFGMRVLAENGGRPCKCDLARWVPEDGEAVQKAEESAHEFGRQLRLKALAEWQETDPKAAKSRASSKRFGTAVPPISGIVAVMAVMVAKIPVMGAIAAILAATALSAVVGILSLTPELAAINRAARKLREARSFPRRDDEEAVIRCAMAHAWKETLPPILALIHR
ncbi:MAG: hypothetical protein V4689_19885 [Verrucomicrobiota bacterium]